MPKFESYVRRPNVFTHVFVDSSLAMFHKGPLPQPDDAAGMTIDIALKLLRTTLRQFFAEQRGLPTFEAPAFVDDEVRQHIARLQLPKHTSDMYPSLLLHQLFESSQNPDRAALSDRIFHFGQPSR
jgi:hypothetical protein